MFDFENCEVSIENSFIRIIHGIKLPFFGRSKSAITSSIPINSIVNLKFGQLGTIIGGKGYILLHVAGKDTTKVEYNNVLGNLKNKNLIIFNKKSFNEAQKVYDLLTNKIK